MRIYTAFLLSVLVLSSSVLTAQDKPMGKVDVDWGKPVEKKLYAKNNFHNKEAPKLEVGKWLSEKPNTKGKFVLVDFWATWCGPCRRLIPELNEFSKTFADDLVVIGISDEPEAKVKAMKQPVINYYSAVDTDAKMKEEVGVQGIPHVLLIDPNGKVCWQGFPGGDDPLNAELIKKRIATYKAALEKK